MTAAIAVYSSFAPLGDCGSCGGSFVAELVSPFWAGCPSLPQRYPSSLGGDIAYLSRHGAPTGPGTMGPTPSEAKQVSQGYHTVAQIPQAP